MTDPFPLDSPAAAILAEAARGLGLPESWPDRVYVTRREHLPSCFPVTDLAVASVATAGLALADLLAEAGEMPAPVTVNVHLALAWFRSSLSPLGWSLPAPWDPIAGDYRAADRWIKPWLSQNPRWIICVLERTCLLSGIAGISG